MVPFEAEVEVVSDEGVFHRRLGEIISEGVLSGLFYVI